MIQVQARVIESPSTLICFAGRGLDAGPPFTLPSAALNSLPWQGQWMIPSDTLFTEQPWWVQIDENALNSPEFGWVTTTPC
jgi:hypothetical protein